ncbi:MAG TPA: hypothetical protein VGV69_10745 [Solirubrobacterales bacterium]|nr:hypothetical protein [Solirubrobacterales bacterium]
MTRKIRTLALALFALAATSAFASSTASAVNFTAASYPVTLTAGQETGSPVTLTLDGYSTLCHTADFQGSLEKSSEEVTLYQGFYECTFGTAATPLKVNVAMNGCTHKLNLTSVSTADFSLVCPPGQEMKLGVAENLCVVEIPPFQKLAHVKFSNNHPNIRGEFEVTGITATLTDPGKIFCPFTGNTTVTDGKYTGSFVMGGENGKGEAVTIDLG